MEAVEVLESRFERFESRRMASNCIVAAGREGLGGSRYRFRGICPRPCAGEEKNEGLWYQTEDDNDCNNNKEECCSARHLAAVSFSSRYTEIRAVVHKYKCAT